eukprot:SAG22_NODE_736_length_7533_cov_9.168281_1_plen_398_part_00
MRSRRKPECTYDKCTALYTLLLAISEIGPVTRDLGRTRGALPPEADSEAEALPQAPPSPPRPRSPQPEISMRAPALLVALVVLCTSCAAAAAGLVDSPLFSSGMILQRGSGAKIWGSNATAAVKVTVSGGAAATSPAPGPGGAWIVSLPLLAAAESATVTVTDGVTTETLTDVAIGDVLLCGGQSNMGFGMCGATVIPSGPHPQTPAEAMAALPTANPIRFFNQHGDANGGAGSTVKGNACHSPATTGNNKMGKAGHWFKAGANNSGAASAVCMLTAKNLRAALGGAIPVGAVESCVGGTPVEPWTPPSGSLYTAHIKPLLPMRFFGALWDQGERDAKTTNTTWYSTEFPKMISGWRAALQTPELPFVLPTASPTPPRLSTCRAAVCPTCPPGIGAK